MPSRDEQEILRVLGEWPAHSRVLPREAGVALRARVVSRYSSLDVRGFIWDRAHFPAAAQGADHWREIGKFVGERRCYLFLAPSDGDLVVELDSGEVLTALLGATYGFEFYVCDENGNYLICFNHHDALCGGGDAARWISQLPGARIRPSSM